MPRRSRCAAAIFSLLLVGAGCNNTSTPDAAVTPDVATIDVVMDAPPIDVAPDVPSRCTSNAGCATNPAGTVCDTTSGQCVGCNTTPDTCTAMQYCDPIGRRCAAGCHSDEGCTGGQHCDTSTHACVACTSDAQCPAGNLCRGNTCVMGCTTGTMCPTGSSCCNNACVNTQTNLADCGTCGNLCRAPNGVAACTAGVCGIGMCTTPYANCDSNASNGCETNTQSDSMHCGMCGNACMARPNSTPTCAAGSCAFTCSTGFADCDGMADNGCETDIRSSATNCGACGRLCNPANAMGTCTEGACRVGGCNDGFADCDMDTATGCETPTATNPASCGTCGNACPTRANATSTCAAGTCGIRCADGFADCDGDATNGCEVDTRSDLANCGRCTAVCTPTGGSAACSAGVCGVTACATGFGDCDGDASNGCETDVRTNATHCGMCRNSCIAGPSSSTACTASACRLTCTAGFGNCDGNALNGCEVNTNVSPTNCGSCGTVCATGQICNAGVCETPCPGVQTRCSGTCVDTDSSMSNCGRCGNVCATGNACMSGACVCRTAGTPTTSPYNGVVCGSTCIDVLSNNTNCGGCGVVCATGSTCMRGTCRCPTTGGGLGVLCGTTCVDTISDRTNCGRCGNVCPTGQSCSLGLCR